MYYLSQIFKGKFFTINNVEILVSFEVPSFFGIRRLVLNLTHLTHIQHKDKNHSSSFTSKRSGEPPSSTTLGTCPRTTMQIRPWLLTPSPPMILLTKRTLTSRPIVKTPLLRCGTWIGVLPSLASKARSRSSPNEAAIKMFAFFSSPDLKALSYKRKWQKVTG